MGGARVWLLRSASVSARSSAEVSPEFVVPPERQPEDKPRWTFSGGCGRSSSLGSASAWPRRSGGLLRVWARPISAVGKVLLFFVYITATFDAADGRAPLFGQSGRQIFH